MTFLIRLLVAASVATAAVLLRDVDSLGNVVVSDRLTGTPAAATISTLTDAVADRTNVERLTYDLAEVSTLHPRGEGDVIEIYLKKKFQGQYYHYTAANTDDRLCLTVLRLVGEHFHSVRQKRPEGFGNVRCHYFAEPDCGSGRGQLTKEGLWEQGDLQKEPRRVGNDVVGSWEDEIGSVQCFWIRDKENSRLERGSTGTFAEPTNAQEGVPEAPNGSAIANRVPIEKGLETRGPSTHDNDRLTEVYTDAQYRGSPVAWATQRDAEREYCIPVNYAKGTIVRSIQQHKDSEDVWFVCWYYDDDNCNSHFNPNGVFPAFYLERDQSIYNFVKPIKSMKCSYADPGGWRGN